MRAALLLAVGFLSVVQMVSLLPSGPLTAGASATATVSASGGTCTQTVNNTSGVTVTRIVQSGTTYCVIRFGAVGDRTWSIPTGVTSADVLIVAGGGGGGGQDWAGGGGGGGVVYGAGRPLSGSSVSIGVGAGGAGGATGTGGNTAGKDGGNSSFGTVTARGGGGGAGYGWNNSYQANGREGGSGGGAGEEGGDHYGWPSPRASGGSADTSAPPGWTAYGHRGGDIGVVASQAGAGGGGAGGAGGGVPDSSSSANRQPGSGGSGRTFNITGSNVTYGGGGGGATSTPGANGSCGQGGSGGGGRGTCNGVVATPGTNGLGGGGGGGQSSVGERGGNGVVIVRYALQTQAALTFSTAPSSLARSASATLGATGGSGSGALSYSRVSGPCTVSGTTVTASASESGDCVVRATRAEDSVYLARSVDRTIQVRAIQTITFVGPGTQAYSPTPIGLVATANSGLAVSLTSLATGVCTVSGTDLTLLRDGTCTVRASRDGDATWFAASDVTVSFTVEHASQTISFSTVTDRAFATQSFGISATATSGLTVTFTSADTNVCTVSGASVTMLREGTCSLTAQQPGNATQFLAAESVTQTFSITKATQVISFTQPGGRTYGDASFAVTVSTDASGLTPAIASTTSAVCAVSATTVTIVSAGECSLVATQGGDDRYSAATPVTRTFTVAPKALTITGSFTVQDRVYDGTTAATIATPSLALVGVVGADEVSLVPSATFATRDAGADRTVSISASSTLTGARAANYTLSLVGAPTATATITPRPLSVVGASTVARTYDGTASATISGASISGVIGGDSVSLTGATSGTAASADVGTHAVTTTMGLSGTHADNYELTQPALTLTVSPRPVSLTGTRVYDGTTTTAASVLTIAGGLVPGETLTLSGTATTLSPDVGDALPLTPASVTLGDNTGLAANYTLTGGTHTLTITPRPVRGTFTVTGRPYDATTSIDASAITSRTLDPIPGQATSGVVAVTGVTDDVQLTGGTATLASPDADETTPTAVTLTGATLTGTRAANYTLESVATTTTTITRRTVTISGGFTVTDRTYDATTDATIATSTLQLVDTILGDDVTLAAAALFDQADAGDAITIRLAPSSGLTGARAANYRLDLAGSPTTTATITARTLTVASGTFTVAGKVYDGTDTATITTSTLALTGYASGDGPADVTWTPTARFTDTSAGAARTVELVGGAVLSGPKGAGYVLDVSSAPVSTAAITPRQVTVTGAIATARVFDGTTDVTIVGATLTGAVAGDTVSLSGGTVGVAASRDAGTRPVATSMTLIGADAANYSLVAQPALSVTIAPLPVTVTLAPVPARVYDGSPLVPLDAGVVSVAGLVAGDTIAVSGTATASSRGVGTHGLTVTPAYSPGAGTLLENYILPETLAGTVTITPRTLTVAGMRVLPRAWDGTTTAVLDGARLEGVLPGDDVTLSRSVFGTFESSMPGLHRVRTQPTLAGRDASNYRLGTLPTLTGTITHAPAALRVTGGTMQFADGTPRTVRAAVSPADAGRVVITYPGGSAPTAPGTYTVEIRLDSSTHEAEALTVTLTVDAITAAVRPFGGTDGATGTDVVSRLGLRPDGTRALPTIGPLLDVVLARLNGSAGAAGGASSIITRDSEPVPVRVHTPDGLTTVVEDEQHGVTLEIATISNTGAAKPVDRVGSLRVEQTGSINVSGTGYLAGSTLEVWLFSEPELLGTAVVDENGRFKATFLVDTATGEHTVQINGLAADAAVHSASLALTVAERTEVPGTTLRMVAGEDGGAPSGPAWLLVLAALLGASIHRWWTRRPDADEDPCMDEDTDAAATSTRDGHALTSAGPGQG